MQQVVNRTKTDFGRPIKELSGVHYHICIPDKVVTILDKALQAGERIRFIYKDGMNVLETGYGKLGVLATSRGRKYIVISYIEGEKQLVLYENIMQILSESGVLYTNNDIE